MNVEIRKIFNHINKSCKKSLINKILKRLSELKFMSNRLIKSKSQKYVVKKILPSLKSM